MLGTVKHAARNHYRDGRPEAKSTPAPFFLGLVFKCVQHRN
jgi:hypothetical protein